MTADSRSHTCRIPGCERSLPPGQRHVRYCTQHQDPAQRVEALRHAAVRGDPEAERLLKRAGRATPLVPRQAMQFAQLQRFAIYLGGLGSARRAAELAGIDADGERLAELEAQARQECGDLVDGTLQAATTLGNMSMLLLLQRACELAPQLQGPQLASTLRTVSETVEGLQGGHAPVFSNMQAVISLEPPKPEDVE